MTDSNDINGLRRVGGKHSSREAAQARFVPDLKATPGGKIGRSLSNRPPPPSIISLTML